MIAGEENFEGFFLLDIKGMRLSNAGNSRWFNISVGIAIKVVKLT